MLFTAPNYCRLWEVFFQEKVLKEAKSLLPLKMEKENRIIGIVFCVKLLINNIIMGKTIVGQRSGVRNT